MPEGACVDIENARLRTTRQLGMIRDKHRLTKLTVYYMANPGQLPYDRQDPRAGHQVQTAKQSGRASTYVYSRLVVRPWNCFLWEPPRRAEQTRAYVAICCLCLFVYVGLPDLAESDRGFDGQRVCRYYARETPAGQIPEFKRRLPQTCHQHIKQTR